jgi:hypothetical protein
LLEVALAVFRGKREEADLRLHVVEQRLR